MKFAPYPNLVPGREALLTGQDGAESEWSLWTWTGLEMAPCPEIDHIDRMQRRLGRLSDDVRRLRAHIASLAHCDSGFPATIDELLIAIGRGNLPEEPFHNGCYWSCGRRSTQPRHVESMRVIEAVLGHYLSGGAEETIARRYPFALGFISRTYAWLGPRDSLSEVQRLLLARMQLPFAYFTKRATDLQAVHQDCFGPSGRGSRLDAQIAALAGLPAIVPEYTHEHRATLSTITDPGKRALYQTCCAIAHGVHELSDCHHSAFRWIERWLHAIGTGAWAMETRRQGTERERIGRLLLGYTLALDRWLLGVPMQFLLLDLGHVELGCDPKDQVLRVYAHLGEERKPVKDWLVACLWYRTYYMLHFRDYYAKYVSRAARAGVGLRDWSRSLEDLHG